MAARREFVYFTEEKPSKVIKIRIAEGSNISFGQVLVNYEYEHDSVSKNGEIESENNNGQSSHKLPAIRANTAGVVEKLHVKEGDLIEKGILILEYSSCSHPTVMKDMCAECGADLREVDKSNQSAAVAMVHNIPELMVSMKEAQRLGKADEIRLLKGRKLVLLVDLDQTLIHTTNDLIPNNIKDVFHFRLHGENSPWYHTRLRPFTKEFLEKMSDLYELHICTFGSRTYAHTIAGFIDEGGRYFSHRILSRDECFSAHSKMANLKALFPCGDHMVVIIDDREDVWNFAPNLIHVRPYHFFQHTGDINAPPGLTKREFDDKEGFDFSSLKAGKEEKEKASENDVLKNKSDESMTEGGDVKENASEVLSQIRPKETTDEIEKSAQSVCNEQLLEEADKEKEPNKKEVYENYDNKGNPAVTNEGTNGHKKAQSQEIVVDRDECKEDGNDSENAAKKEKGGAKEDDGTAKIELVDTDDYLLHLQDILRTIHHAYYEIYDEIGDKNEVPDMKRILPYVRRKVLQDVRLVFSGVVPTSVPQEKSRPFLVARSLGASIMDTVNETTTHVIAARLGTAKLHESKKFKHISVVTPDWLWCCAERWEHVDERLYPLNVDTAVLRRKPPAHCTSPDVALQLAVASGATGETEPDVPVYDRVTGKRIFRKSNLKNNDKGKSWSTVSAERPVRRFSDTYNPILSFSRQDIADMDREVEDILHEIDETDDDNSRDGASQDVEQSSPGKKRKHEVMVNEHSLIIGDVTECDNVENESLLNQFRHGEAIADIGDDEPDEEQDLDIADRAEDEEESHPAEFDDLEPEEGFDDSEWCLAGQALEREFLSAEED